MCSARVFYECESCSIVMMSTTRARDFCTTLIEPAAWRRRGTTSTTTTRRQQTRVLTDLYLDDVYLKTGPTCAIIVIIINQRHRHHRYHHTALNITQRLRREADQDLHTINYT
jgi:hypothetical protein